MISNISSVSAVSCDGGKDIRRCMIDWLFNVKVKYRLWLLWGGIVDQVLNDLLIVFCLFWIFPLLLLYRGEYRISGSWMIDWLFNVKVKYQLYCCCGVWGGGYFWTGFEWLIDCLMFSSRSPLWLLWRRVL